MDLCKFKAGLVYRASPRTARAVRQRNPVLKNKQQSHKSGTGKTHRFQPSTWEAEIGGPLKANLITTGYSRLVGAAETH